MANVYQRAVSQRKLIYLGTMLGLLVCTLFVRGMVKIPVGAMKTWSDDYSIEGRALRHDLTELSQGDADLAGSAVQLLLTGSRGLAVCALWNNAIEKQKRHEWNELEVSVKSITKLQPHFSSPWLFQSWNIAYNVSVEMDRLNDMYFYIAKGINILAEGDSKNKNNPDMRYFVGFYYQNKFGVSDKVTTLRCLYQLSCIPEPERNPDRFVNPDKSINMQAIEEFVTKNPQLVRRLKEKRLLEESARIDKGGESYRTLISTPRDLVLFLKNNEKVPTRYKPGTKELKDRLLQFPVIPDLTNSSVTTAELDFKADIADHEADAFIAARGWFSLGNTAIPPPDSDPAKAATNPDPTKYRIPKRPAMIVYRQGPMRAQTYVAERLTKEGWFDNDPWEVDDLTNDQNPWFVKVVAGKKETLKIPTPTSAQLQWQDAWKRWRTHGEANGLYIPADRMSTMYARATAFANKRGISIMDLTPPLTPTEEEDDELRLGRSAHLSLTYLRQNQRITNSERFDAESEALGKADAMAAKKFFFLADRAQRVEANLTKAAALYKNGFDLWTRLLTNVSTCRRVDRNPNEDPATACKDFRDHDLYQEEVYELNLKYVKILSDLNQTAYQKVTANLMDMTRVALAKGAHPFQMGMNFGLIGDVGYLLAAGDPSAKVLPAFMPDGPFDGNDRDGVAWITDDVKMRIKQKLGLIKQPTAEAPPAEGPATPNPDAAVK
jgi:hypothetical protein